MTERFLTVKAVTLNNNCPECYNNTGLELTFKQKFKENSFYKSLTKEFTQDLECKNCHEVIYPVRWTDDIERVIDYQKRAFVPKPSGFKLKRLSWIVILTVVLLLAVAGVLLSGVL